MPKPAMLDDAPHHLKLLETYATTAVTLAGTLLGLSVAFSDKFVKPPIDLPQIVLLISTWVFLFLALICGLIILARLNGVSLGYAAAREIAFPDAVKVLKDKLKVDLTDATEVTIDATQQNNLKKHLELATKDAQSAHRTANISFWMFGFAFLSMGLLGCYSSIYKASYGDASSAVKTSVDFVTSSYKLAANDAQLLSLTFDDVKKQFTVELQNKQTPQDKYNVLINAQTNEVIGGKKVP